MRNENIICDLRKLVNGEKIENEGLAQLLENHKCLYVLSKIPSRRLDAIIHVAMNQRHLENQYAECEGIFKALCDVPYSVIKGAVLSDFIYPNPAYRISGDIDLLAAPVDAEKIKKILVENGYIQGYIEDEHIVPYTRQELVYQKTYTHQLAAFVKKTGNPKCPFVCIDVNFDIMWGEGNLGVDIRSFLKHTFVYELYGMKLPRLEPVYEFISLCMHHYKDWNSLYLLSERGVSLSLFLDIYYYIVKVSPNIAVLKQVSDTLEVTDYITFCLYHTNQLLRSPKLEEYLKVFQPEKAQALLMRVGLAEDEYKYVDFERSDCIFDSDFAGKFAEILTENDRKKIEINRRYM